MTPEQKLKQQLYRKSFKGKYNRSKEKAKERNLPHNISYPEYMIIIATPCYYCQEPNNSGGLDRIDNTQGYTVDNVLSCCPRCNYTRNKYWTVEETKAMIKAGLKLRNSYGKKK